MHHIGNSCLLYTSSTKYLLVVRLYGNLSTTTATSEINENVESMSRFLTTNRNIELLEDVYKRQGLLTSEGPATNAEEEAFIRAMQRKKKKKLKGLCM